MSPHPIVGVESAAQDPQAAAFFSRLFGWQMETAPANDHITFETKPGAAGGLSKLHAERH